MPLYKYTAATQDGTMVKGEREALDKTDLQNQLTDERLFLMSWKEQKSSWSAPLEKVLARLFVTNTAVPIPTYWIVVGCLISMLALWFSEGGLDRHRPTTDPPPAIVEKIQKVRTGMTRGEVEMLFRPIREASLPPAVSRYFEPPNTLIDVTYVLSKSSRSEDQVKGVLGVYPARK